MTNRIAEIAARCEKPLTGRNKYHGHIATKSSKHGEGVYDTIIERLYQYEYEDIPYLLSQLAERDRTIERLREAIAGVHKSLDFADSQRQSCKNYTELAINNGLALGRIAVTLKHDFKEPLPAAPEEVEQK